MHASRLKRSCIQSLLCRTLRKRDQLDRISSQFESSVPALEGLVFANGRLMQARLTGQPRYFAEVSRRLGPSLRVVSPERYLGSLAAHAWEQFVLPGRVKDGILWSPGNTGPLRQRRQVVTIHDTSMIEHPEWFEWKFAAWYKLLLPKLAKISTHVLTVSEHAKSRIVDICKIDQSKVTVAYNAVDPSFRPVPEEDVRAMRDRLSLGPSYILVVGSVQPRKNLGRLLSAWRSVEHRLQDTELVIAGGSFKVFKDVGLGDLPQRVRMLGYVDEADLPALYSGCLAFCYPSLYEGFGMPTLEAMACGAPVITSNSTALPEVVGDAAILVDPMSVDEIGSAIVRVARDASLRAGMKQRGERRLQAFNWDQTAEIVRCVLNRASCE